MIQDEYSFAGLALATVVLCMVIGLIAGSEMVKSSAVEKGHAYYHPQTGSFTWKESDVEKGTK